MKQWNEERLALRLSVPVNMHITFVQLNEFIVQRVYNEGHVQSHKQVYSIAFCLHDFWFSWCQSKSKYQIVEN